MLIDGESRRSVWLQDDGWSVGIIDQTALPHALRTVRLATLVDAAHAISTMQTRGAPLIGAVAAYGMCLALRVNSSDAAMDHAYAVLLATRPTAVNLKWALDEIVAAVRISPMRRVSPLPMPAPRRSVGTTSSATRRSGATALR